MQLFLARLKTQPEPASLNEENAPPATIAELASPETGPGSLTPPPVSNLTPNLPKGNISQQHLLLIALLFIPLMISELYTLYNLYQTQRESVLQAHLETARSIGQVVTALVRYQNSNNQALGSYFDGSRDLIPGEANSLLNRFRHSDPILLSYLYLDENGRVVYADPPTLVGRDYSALPAFQRLKTGASYSVSDVSRSDIDRTTPSFMILTPVLDRAGNRTGTLAASINTLKLDQVISVKFGKRGNTSIHDSKGISVFISTMPEETYERRVQRASPPLDFIEAALRGEDALVYSTFSRVDGLERMGVSTPIPGIGWVASVSQPVDDAMDTTIKQIISHLILSLSVAIIALVAAWLYSRHLIRPLLALRQAAVEFGQGNLDRRAPVNHRTTELEQLALSFNQMAEEVARDTRSKDAFLSQVSHELKTPVTATKGFAQILLKSTASEINRLQEISTADNSGFLKQREKQFKMLQSIEHQSNRMADLVNRILDLTRIQEGKIDYNLGKLDFAGLVERSIEAASQLTILDRHVIEQRPLDPAQPNWIVWGDELRLEQVVLNLLENAIKYSPKGGGVTVKLRRRPPGELLPETALELSVQDNGLGLDPADLERIFERYYRASTTDHSISGLGLGLFISAEIIQQHRGRLWATSTGPGLGSTFHLALPLYED